MSKQEHLNIIVADELRRIRGDEKKEKEETIIIEQGDITTSNTVIPNDSDKPKEKNLPVRGEGTLDLFSVRSSSDNFRVSVSVDNNDIIDNRSYNYLDNISPDLNRISAYQSSDGDYVVAVTDYPFKDITRCSIHPDEELTLTLVRVEFFMDNIKDGINTAPTL